MAAASTRNIAEPRPLRVLYFDSLGEYHIQQLADAVGLLPQYHPLFRFYVTLGKPDQLVILDQVGAIG